jgi:hypothetical protein
MMPPSDRDAGRAKLALSVRQPWAELILTGRKTIEVRGWETDYRGPLWLHTGRHVDSVLEAAYGFDDLFRGGFVGCVDLVSVVPLDRVRWDRWRAKHLAFGPLKPLQFGWILKGARRLAEPLPAPGQLGLFEPPQDVLIDLERRLSNARRDNA